MAHRQPWTIPVALKPMPIWLRQPTESRRDGQFKHRGVRVSYETTLAELKYEVWQLDGDNILIGVGLDATDIRQDGAPRANAKPHRHPGAEVSFDSRHGRLTYATDVFNDWRDNVRAITKGLEALRAVDRWGVASRGEQYAGFALLAAGPSREELGRQLVQKYGGVIEAMRATHPDTGTDDASNDNFSAVLIYRDATR